MIKNIIFDFGDIFINLDKQATYRALAKLGVTNISDEMMQVYHQYEMGLIATEDFIKHFKLKFELEKEDLVQAWNAILLDFPKYRLDFIKQLAISKKYRLFLLSNTNELHISSIKNSVGDDFYNEFKSCFERFYLSHEIHLRKPNEDIFEFVLSENNLKPQETYFIDDTEENTETASKLGIYTWNLQPKKEDIINLLKKEVFTQ